MPKALIKELYLGEKHAISGSRFRIGPKPTQGGEFNKTILCREHEAMTGTLDTYATNFVRRAQEFFDENNPSRAFRVYNPRPDLLARFALSIIWREVHASIGTAKNLSLGPYETPLSEAVFNNGELRWPLLISRANFTLETDVPIRFAVAPYRIKLAERHAWSFTLAGFSFFVVSDRQGLSILPDWLRSDISNPAHVIVGHKQDFRDVQSLRPIIESMLNR